MFRSSIRSMSRSTWSLAVWALSTEKYQLMVCSSSDSLIG
jgi:hypothetical protein